MNHYVYIITNLINGKKYIGKRSCKCSIEKDKYMGSGLALAKAKEKYGIENFEKKILLVCNSEEEAYEEEEKAIELVRAWENPMYYNMCGGGYGFGSGESSPMYGICGENHPKSKKVVCLNTREIFSTVHEAAKHTRLLNATPITQVCLGKVSTCGKDELGNRLVWRYLEDYEKMTEDEVENTIKETYESIKKEKEVICLNTGEVFWSAKVAHKQYNLAINSIQECCRGMRKFAGFCDKLQEKLVWMYLEDYKKMTQIEIDNILLKRKNSGSFNARYKKFICVNTGEIFSTTTEIKKRYNIGKKSICNCCKGRSRTAGEHPITGERLVWMYLDEYEKLSHDDITNIIKNRQSRIQKKVVCLNTKEIFDSLTSASDKYTNISKSSISACITNKQKFAGKHPITKESLVWVYLEDYEKMTNEEVNNLVYNANKNQNLLQRTKRKKTGALRRGIICVNTGEIFSTAAVASVKYDVTSALMIKKCCQGVIESAGIHPETNEPLVWMSVEDYQNKYGEINRRIS